MLWRPTTTTPVEVASKLQYSIWRVQSKDSANLALLAYFSKRVGGHKDQVAILKYKIPFPVVTVVSTVGFLIQSPVEDCFL